MMYRLEPVAGEWLDRSHRFDFLFEGRACQALAGDCISSALAASGVMIVGRSFKYHRPRGLFSLANHDVNSLFEVDGIPNVRGDVTAPCAGSTVRAVNTFGGLDRDRARVLDRLARFLPVGFYYKAFHSKRWFPRWERLIRTISGLGTVSLTAARVSTPKRYAFCDVLVVGGGPSGLAAAFTAAQAGARVMLVDENARLGGSGQWSRGAGEAVQELVRLIESNPLIDVLKASYAAGYYTDHLVAVVEPGRMTKVRARAVVFATGVLEQPAVFRNNDLPGVMLGSGVQRLLHRYAIAPGRNVVVLGSNREAYELCLDLQSRGVQVSTLADLRTEGEPGALASEVERHGTRIMKGRVPIEARADRSGCLVAVQLGVVHTDRRAGADSTEQVPCDALLMSVGFAPACQLLAQAGATIGFSEVLHQHVPETLPTGVFAAGRCNGVFDGDRIPDGRHAGAAAAEHAGFRVHDPIPAPPRATRRPSHPFPIFDHPRHKSFVDLDEDVQLKDLRDGAQEGFDSLELLKRYTTVGMGPSQGKHSNVNAARILARIRNRTLAEAGLTTMRPMFHPVPLKHLAGRGFQVARATPLHERHEALGAVWMPAGDWQRPEFYRQPDQSRDECIRGEVQAVRTAVGLIDVGTLGKMEAHGPDAGALLDRAYAGRYADLRVGMTRYGLMTDETGTIIDDGVIARLGAERFYFTTTTSGSTGVYREMLRWNALWSLDCALTNVTGHLGAFNLAGPASRNVLELLTDVDLSDAAFPYLAVREGHVCGAPARLLRVGFVGELGYEIHLPAGAAARAWDELLAAGRPLGLRPFGVEAQRMLRLEKGHLIVSQDTDGLTNPFEAQSGWAVKMQKPFFVGQRSLRILQARGPRQMLAGFELRGASGSVKESHLVIDGGAIAGRVTSVAQSPTLGRTIGLAMLRPDLATSGSAVSIRRDDGSEVQATVVPTPFYDPEGLRQKPGSALQ